MYKRQQSRIFSTRSGITFHALSCPRSDLRRVQLSSTGPIVAIPEIGGLDHRYERRASGDITAYRRRTECPNGELGLNVFYGMQCIS
jgi:hypothetical protein